MPRRIIPLVNEETYHVYNRSISSIPVFVSNSDYHRAIEALNYYQFSEVQISFSKFKKLSLRKRALLFEKFNKRGKRLVKILCFCLMPNHFHLLLKQFRKEGISKFIANFQNSYTRYFNLKNKRVGPLLQGTFKAIRIGTDEQLIHVSRYIHLNPYSSLVVRNLEELEKYPWSSLKEYIFPQRKGLSFPKEVLEFFKSFREYKKFVFDRANYQKELEKIKHLVLE